MEYSVKLEIDRMYQTLYTFYKKSFHVSSSFKLSLTPCSLFKFLFEYGFVLVNV